MAAGALALGAVLAVGAPRAHSATSNAAIKALATELEAAVLQSSVVQPLTPNPALGLQANYGPTNMSWKCNPVRSVSTEPLCKLGNVTAQRTVVLYGDSQTNMWAPAFDAWGKANNWLVIDLHKSSCPPWAGTKPLYFDYTPYPECVKFNTFALATIKTLHPNVVIPTGLRTLWARGTGEFNGPDRATFTKQVKAALAALKPLAGRVLMLQQIPHWKSTAGYPPAPSCIMSQSSNLSACVGLKDSNLLDPTVNGAFTDAAKALGIKQVLTTQLFCTSTKCPQVSGNRVIYADPWHYTRVWAQHIAPALGDLLAAQGLSK